MTTSTIITSNTQASNEPLVSINGTPMGSKVAFILPPDVQADVTMIDNNFTILVEHTLEFAKSADIFVVPLPKDFTDSQVAQFIEIIGIDGLQVDSIVFHKRKEIAFISHIKLAA